MINKIFYVLIIVVSFIFTIHPQSGWEKIKTPTDFNLLKVFYLDSLHCWVAGDSGVIMFSGDQGDNWQMQNSGVSNYISDIFFLNERLGWAVTFDYENINTRSKILRTSNGGINWESDNYRYLNINLTTIFFNDSLNGWIGGEPFDLSFTNDGGANWIPANIDTGLFSRFPINEIKFSTSQYGFAAGGAIDVAGVVWRTNNYGELWKAYGIAPDKFDDFLFLDSINALALSADRERSYPIGVLNFDIKENIFSYDSLSKYGRVTSISQRTPKEIWGTLGCDNNFIVSYDGAASWDFSPTDDSLCYFAIGFADSLHGIVAAESGYILKYIPDTPVSVENLAEQPPDKFFLEQNYPNPFNPSTKIEYSLNDRQFVSLKIFDLLGREVITLVNEEKPAGKYEVEFNSAHYTASGFSAMPSGIYFYQLKTNNYIETKKMLLLK